MDWKVRACSSVEELRTGVSPIWHYFGRSGPTDDQIESLARVLPAERLHAAWDGGRVVGGAGAFPFELTVPGGRVRAAGVTVVGVLPSHRRRGVLRAMMRAQLDACRRNGEPIAYLWATEETIYGRFGYGLASLAAEIDFPRERSAYYARAESFGETRLVPLREAEPLVAPVWERVAAVTPGMFARSSAWWQARALTDPAWRRGGGGELRCAVVEARGRSAAYALYRVNLSIDRGVQTGSLDVIEAMGDSPEATRAIWRFLLDVDWTARIKSWLLPVDHPLVLLVAEPRRLRLSVRDALWVRLVDVGAALAARAFAATGSTVIDIADEFCPWNQGRWRVSADGVERTNEPADLAGDVTALGSVYLGAFTWAQLARALRVTELRPGGLARADALFTRHDPAPWCPEMF
ncbi:MAG: GNAT family N-acetyltransferase [Candidatus Rokuibacteriota bacterium]|nr:MAG: GNAT family N-acetyltransferase [Candidatus Rokubacteria bacterium]